MQSQRPMKKILAAVDGSIPSIHAARLGLELARAMGATLTLIHVTPSVILPGDVALTPLPNLREAELAYGAGVLQDVAVVLEGKVERLNLLGSPAEVIADTAMDQGFDLVVVGNKGRGAVSRVLLGSVADRLTHISKRPVLVVR
jgi:nucleotide-binding universal stress UspA family protein